MCLRGPLLRDGYGQHTWDRLSAPHPLVLLSQYLSHRKKRSVFSQNPVTVAFVFLDTWVCPASLGKWIAFRPLHSGQNAPPPLGGGGVRGHKKFVYLKLASNLSTFHFLPEENFF